MSRLKQQEFASASSKKDGKLKAVRAKAKKRVSTLEADNARLKEKAKKSASIVEADNSRLKESNTRL